MNENRRRKLSSKKLVLFPNLTRRDHFVTSDATPDNGPEPVYNCIAWAAGINDRFWWPDDPDSYWPPGIPSVRDIPAFIAAFATLDYEPCPDGTLEAGIEKMAIYANAVGLPTHAARQLESGLWTSKLGRWEDISHKDELVLQGNGPSKYGSICQYMRRLRARP